MCLASDPPTVRGHRRRAVAGPTMPHWSTPRRTALEGASSSPVWLCPTGMCSGRSFPCRVLLRRRGRIMEVRDLFRRERRVRKHERHAVLAVVKSDGAVLMIVRTESSKATCSSKPFGSCCRCAIRSYFAPPKQERRVRTLEERVQSRLTDPSEFRQFAEEAMFDSRQPLLVMSFLVCLAIPAPAEYKCTRHRSRRDESPRASAGAGSGPQRA